MKKTFLGDLERARAPFTSLGSMPASDSAFLHFQLESSLLQRKNISMLFMYI
jgi:hypothetical protein